MAWFVIVVLAVVVILALLAVLVLTAVVDERRAEQARIEMQVRRAERQLHDIPRDGFEAMLDEARTHGPQVK